MAAKNETTPKKLTIWKSEDINGVVYVFAGNIGSFVIAIGTLKGFGWSDSLVFGRVIPGLCLGLLVSGLYYTWMAIRLAKKEGRNDVTALPFGVSTPVMFVYLFSVILPLQFGLGLDPETTWKYGVAATVIGGLIEASGGFIGPYIRKFVPRAAMLATVGGIALAWMGTRGLFDVYGKPLVGMPVLMVALLGLIGGYNFPKKIPPVVIALGFGIILALTFKEATIVLDQLGKFTPPIPAFGAAIEGFKGVLPFLVTIIPVEIYNFIETMDNVESAIAAGDNYNVKQAQIADGICTVVGGLFGSVFPNTVWIGHPGLKKSGCGIGFAWVSATLFGVAGFFGVYNFLYYLIPGVIVSIVFLWCTQIIMTQSFADTPIRYGAAVVIALIPHLADIIYTQTGSTFLYLGAEMTPEAMTGIVNAGAMWSGIPYLKPGAILTGMIWATIVCSIIDRRLVKATATLLGAAILTFFGFIHSFALGFNSGPINITIGYLMAAAVCGLFYIFRNYLKYDKRYDYL
jgi:AGZA family xanthine/uracil permease-like MFS transporter